MSVYKLLIQILGQDKGASRTLKGVRKEVTGLEAASGKLMGAMGMMAGAAGFAYMGKMAVGAAWDLGKLGAQSMRLETAFVELARQAGGTSDAILSSIKKATAGTVSEMDIMAAANKGILLGLGANADQWEKLAEVARFRARAMGLSVTQALADITVGLGRMQPLILDNLGITVDSVQVYGDYARSINKTASELTAAEKKQALMNEVIKVGGEQIEAAGGIAGDAADSFEILDAAIANLKTTVGGLVAKPLAEFALEVAGSVKELALSALLWDAVLKGTIDPLTAMTAELEYGRIKHNQGAEAALAFMEAVIREKRIVSLATGVHGEWNVKIRESGNEAAIAAPKVYTLADAWEAAGSAYREWVKARIDADIAGMDPYETPSGRLAAEEILETQKTDNAKREEDRADNAARVWGESYRAQQRAAEAAYDKIRSAIESALTPTSVTALDMEQTALGVYVDKWDEDARRAEAIAQGGFAALTEHPEWIEALKIPAGVLAGGETGLKAWADKVADDVRNLFRPDLIDEGDLDAMVNKVNAYLQNQANRETTIKMVAAQVGMSEQDVGEALGDTSAIGIGAAETTLEAFKGVLVESQPAMTFAVYFGQDITANKEALKTKGVDMWLAVEDGLLEAINNGQYVQWFISRLASEVAAFLRASGQWGGA